MTRVVLIEDRVLMLSALRDSIAWLENGLDPIGFFESCDEALPFILTEKPDVVVTDIVMHGMNGIALCEKLRQEGLDAKVIIISAYGRFEYAQKALQMGVFDYFEKPIDYDKLVQSIRRAGEERRNAEQMLKYVANHMAFYRERFFTKLLAGQLCDEAVIEGEAAFLGLDARRPMCCLALDIFPVHGEAAQRGMRRELTALMLSKRIETALGGGILGPFSLREDDMALVLVSGEAYSGAPESACEPLREAITLFSREQRLRIRAGLGREAASLSSLKHSYDSALETVEACFLFSESTLLTQADIPRGEGAQWREFMRFEEALLLALRQEDALAADAAFDRLRTGIRESYIPRDSLKALMKSALIKAQAVHMLENALLCEALRAMDGAASADELIEAARRHAGRICEAVRDSGVHERNRLINAMREYAQTHFCDPQFNLADLSRHVAMSPNYVSSLFKKVQGVGLHEYVTELRIERARELLSKTDIGVGRIGEMVGYPNPYYFSVNFKKFTSYTPTEYRRRNQISTGREE